MASRNVLYRVKEFIHSRKRGAVIADMLLDLRWEDILHVQLKKP